MPRCSVETAHSVAQRFKIPPHLDFNTIALMRWNLLSDHSCTLGYAKPYVILDITNVFVFGFDHILEAQYSGAIGSQGNLVGARHRTRCRFNMRQFEIGRRRCRALKSLH